MAVHIRLQRKGTTNRAFYHVVAIDHKARRDGRCIERLGYYDPNASPSLIELKADKIQYWYSKGAQFSSCVANLVKLKHIPLSRKPVAAEA